MPLEDSSMWVRIFEGTLSGENFKITEDNRPQVVIPINVFSYYYKVKVETEQAKPWWWLAGTLVERVGTSSEIDRLEINRYVIPSNREILLRPTFNNRAFYYIFEPAYWHTKIFVQLWIYIDDPENVQYLNFLDVDEPSQGDIWTSLATKNYVQDLFSGHLSLTNPHGITPGMIGAVTQTEINEALREHLTAINPHPQYLTQAQGDISYAPRQAIEQAIASHQAATNPHNITPGAIGAAAASHSHTGTQITGNISGSAGNITGIAAITNGGTGASSAPTALINLGAAAINHLHNIAQISDVAIGTNSISLGTNLKIGWGISDNLWQEHERFNTIFKNIITSSAGFLNTPIYFTSLYGIGSHWLVIGSTSIYEPTRNGFRVYITIPSHVSAYTVTPALAAEYNWRIAWLGIQAS